jgi:DNA-binding NtrC family response regulator
MDKERFATRTRDILIVDDNIFWQQILSIFLESAGFDVTATSDGTKALELLEYNKFRIIITDFNMPELNGVELAIKVKERHPDTLVFLITGSAISEVIEEAVNAGISEMFSKPVDLKVLAATIRSSLYPWQKTRFG